MTRSIPRHTTLAALVLLTALSLLPVSASAATTTPPTSFVGISLPTIVLPNPDLLQNEAVPPPATSTDASTTVTPPTASLIQSLYAEVKALEARIAAFEGQSAATTTTAISPTFTRNLALYDQGPDALALQQFLNAHGALIAASGPGSPGHETDLFGPRTYDALLRFQAAHDLPATGYFGPLTRGVINTLAGSNAGTPSNGATNAPAPQSNQTPTTQGAGLNSPFPGLSSISLSSPGFGGGGGGGGGGASPTPDTTPPTVSLTAPSTGATLSGSSVTLTATASDNVAVASVQFEVDGTDIGSAITSSPYTTTWNSTGVADGTHTLYAVAKDTSGNYATSSESVTTENTPVSISSISSGTPTTTSATITWTTNETASSTVAYGTTTAYGSASSSASLVTSHSIILSGLTANTTYHFQVQATNAAGNYATSSDQTFTTATNPPVISSIASSTTATAATITWSTDQSANSKVVYGTTTGYGSASSSASLVTSHSISLSGLSASTAYHYEVVSTNGSSQTSTSTDQTFTTTGVPTCAQGSTYSDGCQSAPSGAIEYSTLFTSPVSPHPSAYPTRPPWNVAGVDYYVGYPNGTTLKDPSVGGNLPSCAFYSNHLVRVSSTPCVLSDLLMDGNDGAEIYLDSGAGSGLVTVEYSSFAIGPNTNNSGELIQAAASFTGSLLVQDNTFNGTDPGSALSISDGIDFGASNGGSLTVKYNYFYKFDQHDLDIDVGSTSTTTVNLVDNLAVDTGMQSTAHPNFAYFCGGSVHNATQAFNTLVNFYGDGSVGDGDMLLYHADGGCGSTATIQNSVLANDTILMPGTQSDTGSSNGSEQTAAYNIALIQESGQTLAGIRVGGVNSDSTSGGNYIDYTGALGPYYPVEGTGNTFSNNVNISTGNDCEPSGFGIGTCN